MTRNDQPMIAWSRSTDLVPYEAALAVMEQRADLIHTGQASELVWLLEHPPLYTAGTSTNPHDLRDAHAFPVYPTGRGGQLTYHGPGQRVAYVMLDVRQRFGSDVRAFVTALERWIIAALRDFGLQGETRPDRVGVWIGHHDGSQSMNGREEKIAAIGIRIRHGVSFHGVSLNVAPCLDHYAGIVPCGIREFGVTSLAARGITTSMNDVDNALRRSFETLFGMVTDAPAPRLG